MSAIATPEQPRGNFVGEEPRACSRGWKGITGDSAGDRKKLTPARFTGKNGVSRGYGVTSLSREKEERSNRNIGNQGSWDLGNVDPVGNPDLSPVTPQPREALS